MSREELYNEIDCKTSILIILQTHKTNIINKILLIILYE